MKWNIFNIIPKDASPFKLIERRMVLLKLFGVILSSFSGIFMVAMVMFSTGDSEISRYTLVCQASNIMPSIGYVHAEAIRTFPLDIWLNSEEGGNKLIILKVEVDNRSRYYAIADTENDVPLCLGELSREYNPHIMILPIEYEDRFLIVGEVSENLDSNPPIFVHVDYLLQKGDLQINAQEMVPVYGREFLLAEFDKQIDTKLMGINDLCVITNTGGSKSYNYDVSNCKYSQDSNINIWLKPIIIKDNYFESKQPTIGS